MYYSSSVARRVLVARWILWLSWNVTWWHLVARLRHEAWWLLEPWLRVSSLRIARLRVTSHGLLLVTSDWLSITSRITTHRLLHHRLLHHWLLHHGLLHHGLLHHGLLHHHRLLHHHGLSHHSSNHLPCLTSLHVSCFETKVMNKA